MKIRWRNVMGVSAIHMLGLFGLYYLMYVRYSQRTVIFGVIWFLLCHFSISAGYHRLFCHRTYDCGRALKAVFLFFGAASLQSPVLDWTYNHRRHHNHGDTELDPHSIDRGFLWAHMGWMFFYKKAHLRPRNVPVDLSGDPLVNWQLRHYWLLAALGVVAIPFLLGMLWGDPVGSILVAGFLRLTVQIQITCTLNSVAHSFGTRPYCVKTSARDNVWIALLTFGEGYHNYHHRFPCDFRNGVRWYAFDPTKWFIWSLSLIRLAWNLHATPRKSIDQAVQSVRSASRQAP